LPSVHHDDYFLRTPQAEGKALQSFTSSLIESKAVNKLSVKEASWLSGAM
jgi:hypothetical protein